MITAAITGLSHYLPDYVLTNDEIATMVDTNDEWITTRTGIKSRRVLVSSVPLRRLITLGQAQHVSLLMH